MHPCKNKGLFIQLKGIKKSSEKAATVKSPIHPQSGARFRGKAAKQRKEHKAPSATSFIRPHNPRT